MGSKISTYVKSSIRFGFLAIISTLLVAVFCYAAQIYPDIIVKGAPWYDIRAYTSLTTALSAIGASEKTLLMLGNVAVSADTTIPATTHVWYLGSGKFTIASGKVLTHNGSITAANHLIWAGPGTIVPPKAVLNLDWMGNLANAVALLTTSTCEVEITNAYTQAANVTTPSTMTISFKASGSVSVSSTFTWTIQGPIYGRAGCFQGNGKVVPSALQMNASEWWPSFEKAVGDIGSNACGLLVSTVSVISGNLTVPATIHLTVASGGSLNPVGGTTTTLNCSLTANLRIAFGGSGTIVYNQASISVYTEAELIAAKDFTGEVIVSAAINLHASLTTTCNLKILPNCIINYIGYALIINGPFDAGLYQVFYGAGAPVGVLFGAGSVKEIYPEWWGLVASSTAPSAAIQTANVFAFTAAFNTGKPVKIAAGTYYINDAIAPSVPFLGFWEGQGKHQSIIYQTDPTKDIFHPTGAYAFGTATIRGIGFWYGKDAIYIYTDNNDATIINIEDCFFYKQAGYGIETSTDSHSTGLNISKNTFLPDTTGGSVKTYCDYTNVTENWLGAEQAPVVYNGSGNLKMTGNIGVPYSAPVAGSCWISSYGSVWAKNNRWGGENASDRTILEHHTPPGALITVDFKNNYSPSSDYAYKFFALPQNLVLEGNYGYSFVGGYGCKGIWIASAATGLYMGYGQAHVSITDSDLKFYQDGTGSTNLANFLHMKNDAKTFSGLSKDVLFADIVVSYLAKDLLISGTFTHITVDTTTIPYDHLGGPLSLQATATADDAAIELYRSDLNFTDAAHNYTIVVDCVIEAANVVNIDLMMGRVVKSFQLSSGTHVLPITVRPDIGYPHEYYVNITQMASGDKVRFGRFRVFAGDKEITSVNTLVRDVSTATITNSASVLWSLGDEWQYTNPASAGKRGKLVTTAGTSGGTWKTWGAID